MSTSRSSTQASAVAVPSRARLLPIPKRGMDLEIFLRKYREALRGQRVFYVVKPRLEGKNWCKFGVAQGSLPEAAFRRLRAYTVLYGKQRSGGCKGVRIYLCWCVRYANAVIPTHTRVHRLELRLKRLFRQQGRIVHAADRGSERVHLSPSKVVAAALQLMPQVRTKPQSLRATRVLVPAAVLRRHGLRPRCPLRTSRRQRRARHGLDDLQSVLVTGPRRSAGQNANLQKWHSLEREL